MASSPIPVIPPVPEDVSQISPNWLFWIGQIARLVNTILGGKLNATTTVTLNANATSTILTDSRIGYYSHITLTPTSATAATDIAVGGVYVSAKTKGSATITHPNTADVDKAFDCLIIG